MPFTYELLDNKYSTREEWEKALETYAREPVICAHCLHPVDFDIDAGRWRHKKLVGWCDGMRGEKPIHPIAH
jgi:hypothetical protein